MNIPSRFCNNCKKEIFYKTIESYRCSIKRHIDVVCKSCSNKNHSFWKGKSGKDIPWFGKPCSENIKLILSKKLKGKNNPNYGKVLTEYQKKCFNHKGEKLSQEHKFHISESNKGNKGFWFGKKRNRETVEKIKQTLFEKLRNDGYTGKYNPHACQFIENWGKQNGYNFQHALNGGEVVFKRYLVDGYDKDKNVVFEYDEPQHEKWSKKLKDYNRIKEIYEKCGCEFIRYSEKYSKFYKSFPTYSTIL